MSSFTKPLTVTKIGKMVWVVEKKFTYHVGGKYSADTITVPKGFKTDFASVPRIFWVLLPPDGRYTQAAVLHDYLYQTKSRTRLESDKIFLEAMAALGVHPIKRNIMYYAVRLFGPRF